MRVDGTSSRRFLRFLSLTAFQAEGCSSGFAANFIMPPSAVTSTSSIIIRITTVHPFATSWPSSPKGDARTLRDWLSVSYGMIRILVINRCAAPPYPAAPDFLHGKACHTILRSLCSLTNRVPLPPHPGDRINRSMLSCRDMASWLSIHSAPACGGKVVAPATKGGNCGMVHEIYDSLFFLSILLVSP